MRVGAGDALLAYSTLRMLATKQRGRWRPILGAMAAACECEQDGNVPDPPRRRASRRSTRSSDAAKYRLIGSRRSHACESSSSDWECRAHKRTDASPGADFVAVGRPGQRRGRLSPISQDVPLERYDAALCCIPDAPKIELLDYLARARQARAGGKAAVWPPTTREISKLEAARARRTASSLYRLQSPLRAALRAHARSHRLRRARQIYRCRMFYGNGTARLVRDSAWRDHGSGVLHDLGSHLLDTARFWFGDLGDDFRVVSRPTASKTARPDHVVFALRGVAAAARIRDDAAELAQPLHLRRVRRERQRAYQLAVQVGADQLHRAHARAARAGARRRRR